MERIGSSLRLRAGFSLLEMIIVVAIIGMMAGFIIPAVTGFLGSQRLSTTALALNAELVEAQQLAQTLNRAVELRFYRCVDPESPGSTDSYRARQLMVHEINGLTMPSGAPELFETGTILASSQAFTTVLKNGESSPVDSDPTLPRFGRNYHYFGILFHPGGGIHLPKSPTDRWCLTVVLEREYRDAATLPANFATLLLDSHNGSVTLLQP